MLDILVIGTGMYVSGKGTEQWGTILPSLMMAKKEGLVNKVVFASSRKLSKETLDQKYKELKEKMNVSLDYDFFPKDGDDPKAYEKALETLGPNRCAYVCTPDHLHFEQAKFLIEKKVPLMVVKPLVPTLKEAQELVSLADENGVYGAVEFHKRFDRSNRKLKYLYQQGHLGRLSNILVEYSQRITIPRDVFKEWAHKTNIFQYLGVHYVDIIHFVTKGKPVRVSATGQKDLLKSLGVNTYDAIQANIEWQVPSGETFNSLFMVNWIDPEKTTAMSDQKFKFIGTQGRYEADQKDRGIHLIHQHGNEAINPDFSQYYLDESDSSSLSLEGYGPTSVVQFLRDVKELKEGKIKLNELNNRRPSFVDTLSSVQVSEAVNRSLEKNGEWIQI